MTIKKVNIVPIRSGTSYILYAMQAGEGAVELPLCAWHVPMAYGGWNGFSSATHGYEIEEPCNDTGCGAG
jgi:hypothetical protein